MNDSKIAFQIDDRTVEALPNETILQAASRAGISIPTLCHHRDVSHTTSCFVCVVKDVATGRFLPSCAAMPAAGQKIAACSPDVLEMRKDALNLLLSEHTGDCEAPCTIACPAHAAVEEYVREGKKGNFLEALRIIKRRVPFPLSIGRICPRFCEKNCRRNIEDAPVAINEFKRLAADLHYDTYMEDLPPLGQKKVAVVGGGPGGLAIAYYLRLQGISSHVLEALPELGGMQRYGIPEYRLPKAILKKEIDHLFKMGGITAACNQTLGDNVQLDALTSQYDAVALAIGCQAGASMRCDGEELATSGIDWLARIARNNWRGDTPRKTIVVGGGNTAMDCVRTAVRLGSESVYCFYRRTEKEMPAESIEIAEAKEEGVQFTFLVAPIRVEKTPTGMRLTCIRMELGAPDASGRQRPVPVAGSEFVTEADTIIAAIGQKTVAPEGIPTNRWGDVDVDTRTLMIRDGVFAAGDCVTGAASVVEAVAAGYKVAHSISDYFQGVSHDEPALINVSRGHWQSMGKDDLVLLRDVSKKERLQLAYLPADVRKHTFDEVTMTASSEAVMAEGDRCYECSCTDKQDCMLKRHAQTCGASPDAIRGERYRVNVDVRHPVIVHDGNKCIKCGICIKVCREVVEKNLLGYKKRGFSVEVGPAYGKALPDSCAACMACVDHCPTGALDRKVKQ